MTFWNYVVLGYFWSMFLFGYFYYSEKMNRTWTSSQRAYNLPIPVCAFFCSVATCWWYWPLMVFYTGKRVREEKEAKEKATLEEVTRFNRDRQR